MKQLLLKFIMSKIEKNTKSNIKIGQDEMNAVSLSNLVYWERNGGEIPVRNKLSDMGYDRRYLGSIEKTDTQYFLLGNENETVICVRGTKGKKDVVTDIDLYKYDPLIKKAILRKKLGKEKYKEYRNEVKYYKKIMKNYNIGYMHFGVFKSAYETLNEILPVLNDYNVNNIKLYGHSLGAGVVTILAMLLKHHGFKASNIITFGSLRVGGIKFARNYNKVFKNVTKRFFNDRDMVARTPPRFLPPFFMHVSKGIYIDNKFKLFSRFGNLKDLMNWIKFSKQPLTDHYIMPDAKGGYYEAITKNFQG